MRVISRKTLVDYVATHPDSRPSLETWFAIAKKAKWQNLAEVKGTFRSADLVGRVTVFNIKGNDYRLVVDINYKTQIIYILEFYTHAEYDKVDLTCR